MRVKLRMAIAYFCLAILLSAGEAHAGLISYWAADGDATDSVGPNSGALVGGVSFAPGFIGEAFHFDGSSYMEAPTIGMPTGNGDRTINLWFNVDAYSPTVEEAFLAGYGVFGSFDQAYAILVNHFNISGPTGDRVAFSQWGEGIIGGPAIAPGTWHNLGVTSSGDFATLYLDGFVVATGTLTIDTPSGTPFVVGRVPGALGSIRQLDGLVDEIRVYDTALSAAEIQALAMIPEPSPALLVGLGLVALGGWSARRRGRAAV
jgi:hypothetical protein